MGDVISALFAVVVAIGSLLALLGGLYWLTGKLPKKWQEGARSWVFLLPTIVALIVGLLIPTIRTIYLSLLDDNGKSFVGLDNFETIFTTRGTRLTVFNSMLWVFVGTTVTIVVGLTVARFADGMRGEKAAKSAIFIPGAISLVGAGIIWKFVYDGPPFEVGMLNSITKSIPGLPASMGGNGDRIWLLERGFGGMDPPASAPGFNTFLLIVIFIWASAGFATVIFSAAIKGVPDELIEAARVDGATDRQAFYKVTLPYIRSTIVTVATIVTIGGLKAFDIVAATTGGRFDTSTIANEFYVTKFVQGRGGLGSALAVVDLRARDPGRVHEPTSPEASRGDDGRMSVTLDTVDPLGHDVRGKPEAQASPDDRSGHESQPHQPPGADDRVRPDDPVDDTDVRHPGVVVPAGDRRQDIGLVDVVHRPVVHVRRTTGGCCRRHQATTTWPSSS